LVVVGTGIALVVHTTQEAVECMRRAERLFYLVTDPATAAWLERLNPSASSLDDCYEEGKSRFETYQEMAARIVSAVRAGSAVCAAFYGHPGVFVNASHLAIRRLRREGFPARMLPGISAEDCLFADLGLNPGDNGCQNFEATDFLAARRRFDPCSELILWQVGVLGEPSVRKGMVARTERLQVLTDVLRRSYPRDYRVVLYEAPSFPTCRPFVKRIRLEQLPRIKVRPMATLYVPARPTRRFDQRILGWYEEP
jgi:uncharacterized protein YabN with tetrapyrrole methylase and pyrophosphatase domain